MDINHWTLLFRCLFLTALKLEIALEWKDTTGDRVPVYGWLQLSAIYLIFGTTESCTWCASKMWSTIPSKSILLILPQLESCLLRGRLCIPTFARGLWLLLVFPSPAVSRAHKVRNVLVGRCEHSCSFTTQACPKLLPISQIDVAPSRVTFVSVCGTIWMHNFFLILQRTRHNIVMYLQRFSTSWPQSVDALDLKPLP